MSNDQQALADVSVEWGQAIVANDMEAIGRFVTDDWVLVDQTGIGDFADFSAMVESGDLTHTAMQAVEGTERIRTYGDTAVRTARVTNTAQYRGQEFHANEWVTDVYIRVNGRWVCVLTQVTPAER